MEDTAVVWTEVRVLISVDPIERSRVGIDAYLAGAAAVIAQVSPDGYVQEGPDAPPSELAPPGKNQIRFRIYVDARDIETALSVLNLIPGDYPGAIVSVHGVDPDWKESWKKFFVGFEVSPRLAVRPPWEASTRANEVIIEPGLAFGTGHHETTRLCLELVDRLYADHGAPEALLDVGCGTGILSIAAARLGGVGIVGCDCDPVAVEIAQENALLNRVGEQCSFTTNPLASLGGTYPVVVANIMAHILIELCEPLVAHVASKGTLYLSGVLEGQVEEVVAVFEAVEVQLVRSEQAGEWVLLEFSKT